MRFWTPTEPCWITRTVLNSVVKTIRASTITTTNSTPSDPVTARLMVGSPYGCSLFLRQLKRSEPEGGQVLDYESCPLKFEDENDCARRDRRAVVGHSLPKLAVEPDAAGMRGSDHRLDEHGLVADVCLDARNKPVLAHMHRPHEDRAQEEKAGCRRHHEDRKLHEHGEAGDCEDCRS